MVNLGQKLVGCHTSENIGVIKDVIYKVNQVNRDELQFRVEGVTHWFDFSDVPGVWFDEVKEKTIYDYGLFKGMKLTLKLDVECQDHMLYKGEECMVKDFDEDVFICEFTGGRFFKQKTKNLSVYFNEFESEEPKKEYDFINPNHYKQGGKEVIEMMELIWGKENLEVYCVMNAFKYRMRLGLKPEQSVERDLEKAKWYEQKAKELRG